MRKFITRTIFQIGVNVIGLPDFHTLGFWTNKNGSITERRINTNKFTNK